MHSPTHAVRVASLDVHHDPRRGLLVGGVFVEQPLQGRKGATYGRRDPDRFPRQPGRTCGAGGIQIDSRDNRGESADLVKIFLDGYEIHLPKQGYGLFGRRRQASLRKRQTRQRAGAPKRRNTLDKGMESTSCMTPVPSDVLPAGEVRSDLRSGPWRTRKG